MTTIREILDRHAGVLLDAYGVLVDGGGALPGAAALIDLLNARAIPYAIVTNDASRSRATYGARFASFGLAIDGDRVVSSGSLLPAYFRDHGLAGARTCVLGTDDSRAFVAQGGGSIIPLAAGIEIDALVICDDAGFPFLTGMELALSAAIRAIDAGRALALILPNPDLVYPKSPGEFGITAGSMALVIETALARRYPGSAPRFVHLGKPQPHLFLEAARQIGVPLDRVCAIGDQLETDIAGARAAGIACALVEGVSRHGSTSDLAPTYLLATIEP